MIVAREGPGKKEETLSIEPQIHDGSHIEKVLPEIFHLIVSLGQFSLGKLLPFSEPQFLLL